MTRRWTVYQTRTSSTSWVSTCSAWTSTSSTTSAATTASSRTQSSRSSSLRIILLLIMPTSKVRSASLRIYSILRMVPYLELSRQGKGSDLSLPSKVRCKCWRVTGRSSLELTILNYSLMRYLTTKIISRVLKMLREMMLLRLSMTANLIYKFRKYWRTQNSYSGKNLGSPNIYSTLSLIISEIYCHTFTIRFSKFMKSSLISRSLNSKMKGSIRLINCKVFLINC